MVRSIRSISLPKELDEIVEKNIMDFSDYVQNCIKRDFMDKEAIERKINELKNQISELKAIGKSKGNKSIISEEEKRFMEETKKILERDIGFLEGRWNLYRNTFNRKISLSEFQELLGA